MRASSSVVAAAIALVVCASFARAQDTYPAKSITIIVPFPAGGTTDVVGRVVAEGLRQVLGQAVVVDNRSGAAGSLGTAAMPRRCPTATPSAWARPRRGP